ncbi:MAG: flavodoxin family protein [Candidatus Schekmanbacteria bacterium]|nr:flavodoxin family protein [Candidatus Schekmanbacteria bacterium]
MHEFSWDKEAEDTLSKILNIWPAIIRKSWKEKISNSARLIAYDEKSPKITGDILYRGAVNALPKSYEPLLLRIKSPEEFARKKESQEKLSEKEWLIEIKRWDRPDGENGPKIIKKPSEQNVLAIMTSPRIGGNTDILMEKFLDGVRSKGAKVEKFNLQKMNISGCLGCMKCTEVDLPEICVLKDGMSEVYRKFIEADSVVLGFPVYTGRECALTAAFFDRMHPLRAPIHFPKISTLKRGALIGTWGWPSNDSYNHIIEFQVMLLKLFNVITSEIITACGFWGEYYKKGIIERDQKGLEETFRAGASFVTPL